MKKPELTQDQHDELGLELARMQDAVNGIIEKVGTAYLSNGREVKAMERIGKAIERARAIMEDAAGNTSASSYYPEKHGRSGYTRWSS